MSRNRRLVGNMRPLMYDSRGPIHMILREQHVTLSFHRPGADAPHL